MDRNGTVLRARAEATFGNPRSLVEAEAINGIIHGDWELINSEEDYETSKAFNSLFSRHSFKSNLCLYTPRSIAT